MADPIKVLVDVDTLGKLLGAYDFAFMTDAVRITANDGALSTNELDALRVAIAQAKASR